MFPRKENERSTIIVFEILNEQQVSVATIYIHSCQLFLNLITWRAKLWEAFGDKKLYYRLIVSIRRYERDKLTSMNRYWGMTAVFAMRSNMRVYGNTGRAYVSRIIAVSLSANTLGIPNKIYRDYAFAFELRIMAIIWAQQITI